MIDPPLFTSPLAKNKKPPGVPRGRFPKASLPANFRASLPEDGREYEYFVSKNKCFGNLREHITKTHERRASRANKKMLAHRGTDTAPSGVREAGYAGFIGLICVSPAGAGSKKRGWRKQNSPIRIANNGNRLWRGLVFVRRP